MRYQKSFGPVILDRYSYKKMQKKNKFFEFSGPVRPLKVFVVHAIHVTALGFGGS